MTKEQFLKTSAVILSGSSLSIIVTRKYTIKTGLIYKNDNNNYIIVHYDMPVDGCMTIKYLEFNKNYDQIKNDSFYSEEDLADILDSFITLKESKLNYEVESIFNNILMFIKSKNSTIIN